MKLYLFLLAALLINIPLAQAEQISCRLAVVKAYKSLGQDIEMDSFSSLEFEDLNMSVEQFNLLPPSEQDAYYSQLIPLEMTVQRTIDILTKYITEYSSFAGLYILEVKDWRSKLSLLKTCK